MKVGKLIGGIAKAMAKQPAPILLQALAAALVERAAKRQKDQPS